MIPSLADNGTSKACGSVRSILFYPVSLEIVCPLILLLFAVPLPMAVGIGDIIAKVVSGFSFMLKIFETKRRNLLFDVSSSVSVWRSRKEGWKGHPILSELFNFWCGN